MGRVVSLPEKRAGGCRGAALRAMDVGEGLDDPEFLEIRPLENLEDFSFVDLVREDYYSPSVNPAPPPEVDNVFFDPLIEDEEELEQSNMSSAESRPEPNNTVIASDAWNLMIAGAFAQYSQPADALQLPWESKLMNGLFKSTSLPELPGIRPIDESRPALMLEAENPGSSSRRELSVPAEACYKSAIACTKDLDYMESKQLSSEKACGLWLDLLACNWQASTIGEQVCRDLRSDPSGDQAGETLKACFGTKSPNTLLKRASALRRYYKWHSARCVEVGVFVDPIPLEEHDVWAYFQFLRAERHTAGRGLTSPGAFLETIRFCKFTVGLRGVDDILTSGRLLGFAALERREKGTIRQAPPIGG